MLIKRRAFALIKEARPDLSYKPDHVRAAAFDGSREIVAYFMDPIDRWSREKVYGEALQKIAQAWKDGEEGTSVVKLANDALNHQQEESKRLLSEDYFFCQELRKAGGHIWLCPWMRLTHTGTYVFGGSLADLAQIGVAATADVALLERNRRRQK